MQKFTPEQARLVVEAAGLDPARPLTEQVEQDQGDDVSRRLDELSQRLDALTGQQQQPPQNSEERFAGELATRLHQAQSPWLSFGEATNDA
jgi:hypothetical protein